MPVRTTGLGTLAAVCHFHVSTVVVESSLLLSVSLAEDPAAEEALLAPERADQVREQQQQQANRQTVHLVLLHSSIGLPAAARAVLISLCDVISYTCCVAAA
jgi:hypothetical protein